MFEDPQLLAIGGSVLAGGVTAFLTAWITAKREHRAWARSRQGMVGETAAALLRETVTAIAAAGHAACWLTWKAEHDRESLGTDDFKRYDDTMRDLLPRILGGQAAIGTLCPTTARKVMDAVNIISIERIEISRGCVAHRTDAGAMLATRHPAALKSYEQARDICAGLAAHLLKSAR